jgi:hypothetical protein
MDSPTPLFLPLNIRRIRPHRPNKNVPTIYLQTLALWFPSRCLGSHHPIRLAQEIPEQQVEIPPLEHYYLLQLCL